MIASQPILGKAEKSDRVKKFLNTDNKNWLLMTSIDNVQLQSSRKHDSKSAHFGKKAEKSDHVKKILNTDKKLTFDDINRQRPTSEF